MPEYDLEAVDKLPFSTPEKAQRYQTENYRGAMGLNWYLTDPTLQFIMAYYLRPDELAFAEPHLTRIGELTGGPVTRWAEETDRNPPRLERYDRWGHDISRVVLPESFIQSKRAVIEARQAVRDDAARAGVKPSLALFAADYLLNQADIGMACALATGGNMVRSLVTAYAPPDVREFVLGKLNSGEWDGEAAQLLTERAGGSDLGALETTATRSGDVWLLNGFKWFASNCAGEAFVVLAKPEGAPDSTRGVATFLVLRTRRDGSRNGVRIRRLKDKLGTRSVASGEIEFVDAEAFLLSGEPSADAGPSDGKGLTRMMELTNRLRLGTASFALGNARRALVESLCYAGQRRAFGGALIDKPLMRRKLAEMVVDVEAALAMVFDGFGAANHRQPRCLPQRIAVPVTKLKTCRLGITVASDAIEIHGGNGYIETWPVARLLRDAQVNTIWEGPDNILCLDVRRGIEQTRAHETLLARLRDAVSVSDDDDTTRLVSRRIEDLDAAITAWTKLDRQLAEARLFPLAQFMGDVYAGALLTEQAAWERATRGTDRKALVARLYARRYLADQGPLRGIDADCDEALSVSTNSWRARSLPSRRKSPQYPRFLGSSDTSVGEFVS
ncbi:Putative acyl-CoA dehydrogenase FadE35 [Mycobacterium tuberculosis]|nr:Putative acyl-CoA dehydrogenase FadE35 [Mycobacterium tuberculosis]